MHFIKKAFNSAAIQKHCSESEDVNGSEYILMCYHLEIVVITSGMNAATASQVREVTT